MDAAGRWRQFFAARADEPRRAWSGSATSNRVPGDTAGITPELLVECSRPGVGGVAGARGEPAAQLVGPALEPKAAERRADHAGHRRGGLARTCGARNTASRTTEWPAASSPRRTPNISS